MMFAGKVIFFFHPRYIRQKKMKIIIDMYSHAEAWERGFLLSLEA